MNVAYHFYDSTDKVTLLFADEYTYDGADWIKTEDTETLDGPFKKVSGKWNFDPSMTLVGPRPQRLQQELLPGLRGLGTPEQGRRLYDG